MTENIPSVSRSFHVHTVKATNRNCRPLSQDQLFPSLYRCLWLFFLKGKLLPGDRSNSRIYINFCHNVITNIPGKGIMETESIYILYMPYWREISLSWRKNQLSNNYHINPKYWDRDLCKQCRPDQTLQIPASAQGLHCLPYIEHYSGHIKR